MVYNSNIVNARLIDSIISVKTERVKHGEKYKHLIAWFSLSLSILTVIMAFEWKTFEEGSIVQLTSLSENFEDLMDIPLTQQPPPPAPTIQQPMIIEVPDEEEIEEDIKIDLDINMNEEDVIQDIVMLVAAPEEEVAETIYQIVQEMPSPVGGLEAFYAYLNKNLNYPSQARRIGIEGRVFTSFVVEKDGSLTDIVVMKGIGAGCDEEAVRALQNAPKWKPGKQRGVPVRVRYSFPFVFQLN